MNYSLPLTRWLDEEGYEMFGKNDLRFIESLYKVNQNFSSLFYVCINMCGFAGT